MIKRTFTLNLILAIFTIFMVSEASAQQDARYSQYMFNGMLLNPGYTGSVGGVSVDILGRYQWVDIAGTPKTLSLSIHSPLGRSQKYGIGGFLEADLIGVHQRVRLFGSYAYKFQVGEGYLSAGIQGGVLYLNSDFNLIESAQGVFNTDPLYVNNQSNILPNFGLGLYYYTQLFYAGISVPHLLENAYYASEEAGLQRLSREQRHYLFTAGLVLRMGDNLKFVPSALVKTVLNNAPTQFDANASFLIRETLWLGSSFRFTDAFRPESLDFIIGFNFGNGGFGKLAPGTGVQLGYAYDISLNKLRFKHTGSHEVRLGIDFGGNPGRYRTPRYF